MRVGRRRSLLDRNTGVRVGSTLLLLRRGRSSALRGRRTRSHRRGSVPALRMMEDLTDLREEVGVEDFAWTDPSWTRARRTSASWVTEDLSRGCSPLLLLRMLEDLTRLRRSSRRGVLADVGLDTLHGLGGVRGSSARLVARPSTHGWVDGVLRGGWFRLGRGGGGVVVEVLLRMRRRAAGEVGVGRTV